MWEGVRWKLAPWVERACEVIHVQSWVIFLSSSQIRSVAGVSQLNLALPSPVLQPLLLHILPVWVLCWVFSFFLFFFVLGVWQTIFHVTLTIAHVIGTVTVQASTVLPNLLPPTPYPHTTTWLQWSLVPSLFPQKHLLSSAQVFHQPLHLQSAFLVSSCDLLRTLLFHSQPTASFTATEPHWVCSLYSSCLMDRDLFSGRHRLRFWSCWVSYFNLAELFVKWG